MTSRNPLLCLKARSRQPFVARSHPSTQAKLSASPRTRLIASETFPSAQRDCCVFAHPQDRKSFSQKLVSKLHNEQHRHRSQTTRRKPPSGKKLRNLLQATG